MTRLPHENRDVHGLEGDAFPRYKVKSICAHPECSKFADHAHHLWRRSFISGDFCWVELWDHTIVGNLVGLCWRHHEEITLNRAIIVWAEQGRTFVWVDAEGVALGELNPQPPIHGLPVTDDPVPFEGPAMADICPGCKRPLKKPSEKKEGVRRRKTWTVTVPADAQEDGAEVLDKLIEVCADLFQHGEEKNLRYFTLVQALAMVVQHGHLMVADR